MAALATRASRERETDEEIQGERERETESARDTGAGAGVPPKRTSARARERAPCILKHRDISRWPRTGVRILGLCAVGKRKRERESEREKESTPEHSGWSGVALVRRGWGPSLLSSSCG